jgi:hypothetical protein
MMQVLEEGERLSAKQGELEGVVRKLRQQLKDGEAERNR